VEKVVLEASRAKASSRVDGLALELVHARAYIHSSLSMEYGQEGDEPSELQLAVRFPQIKLVEREEALRVATTEVCTLQALLETERQGFTFDSTMERELVCLQHLHDKLCKIAKDLCFNAVRLLRTHAFDDPILRTGFGRLCQAVSDHLGHV